MAHGECLKQVTDQYIGRSMSKVADPLLRAAPLPGPEGGDAKLYECSRYDHCVFSCGAVTVKGTFNVMATSGECVEEPVRRLLDSLGSV